MFRTVYFYKKQWQLPEAEVDFSLRWNCAAKFQHIDWKYADESSQFNDSLVIYFHNGFSLSCAGFSLPIWCAHISSLSLYLYNIVPRVTSCKKKKNYSSGKPIVYVNCMYVVKWTSIDSVTKSVKKNYLDKIEHFRSIFYSFSPIIFFFFTSSCQRTMSKKFPFKNICTYIDNNACMEKKRNDKTCF